jgi:uncharacterized protein with NRDE domain
VSAPPFFWRGPNVCLSLATLPPTSWRSPEPPRERSELANTIYVDPIVLEQGDNAPEVYATRLSTVVLVRRNGQVLFVERDVRKAEEAIKSERNTQSDRVFRFELVR